MKQITTLSLIFIAITVWGQKITNPIEKFIVTGEINKELSITIKDIQKFPAQDIQDVAITNHLGEPRGIAKQLKGVLVKDLLSGLSLKEKNPKLFSEFYFSFVANDQYKVVYSWNEIFNAQTGNNLFLITARDGVNINEMEDRLLILTPSDFKTGRRHIKSLEKIVVKRVD